MRKLFITCDCGQQMQVPRSAIGKMGQCPSCGEKIPINRETTSSAPQARPSIHSTTRKRWGRTAKPSVDAKQQFGRAVDLYCAGRYGEALAIFDTLHAEFPDSTEIERARRQCVEARNRGPLNLPGPGEGQVAGDELDEPTMRAMRRIVVEKLLHGDTDVVQLQAAELIARMAGVLDPPSGRDEGVPQNRVSDSTANESGGNGHAHDHGGGNGYPHGADSEAVQETQPGERDR